MENFTNTFDKGMNKDANILLQPEGTYRNALNCTLISTNGNNYVIQDCMGNVKTFEINIPYNGVYTLTATQSTPIGFASFPDRLVVFSTNSTTAGYGEVGILLYKPYGEGIDAVDAAGTTNFHKGYQVLYHSDFLNFSISHQIESFAFPENDTIKRVYWTDNFNQPRVINIADPIYSTYFASGALSAIVGIQYMVLEGAITYNGVNYGPGLAAGNIFTTTGAIVVYTNLTGASPTPKVILYNPYQLLNWTPDRSLGNINFDSYGTGSKNCGSDVYFYRVGRLGDGIYSSWSYGSAPIHIGMNNDTAAISGNLYHDFVGNGSQTTLVNSGKSVKVNISNIDTYYDVIQLAVAEFDQLIDVPYQIIIVNQTTIDLTTLNADGSITLEDTGTNNLGALTLDDVTLFPASILKVKTLTTDKNYNLIANITERVEFTEKITATITSFEYPLIEQGDNTVCSNLMIFDNMSVATPTVNPGVNGILPFSRWLVSNAPDPANAVEYPVGSGTLYYTGDVFVGQTTFYTATFHGTSQARPCVSTNRYTPITSLNPLTTQRNNAISFASTDYDFWDYKNPAVDQHVRGYWSDEKYRIGILFYDLKGNPFYVRHLGDYVFPRIAQKGGLITSVISVGGATQYNLNPSGLKLNITIPASLIDKISGFSIVRAERDARIMMQGFVGRTVNFTLGPPIIQMPEASIFYGASVGAPPGAAATFTYISPDYNVNYPFTKPVGVTGDEMQEACWLDPYDWGGANYYRSVTGAVQSVVAKFTTHLPDDGFSPRKVNLLDLGGFGWQKLDEAQYFTNYRGPGSNTDFSNVMLGTVFPNVNTACSGGLFNHIGLNNIGGKKLVWMASATIQHYTNATDYSQVDQKQKIMMNYCKIINPANQYGGSGAQAIANTLYISTGHYQPINATVKAETISGSNYIFNDVEVFGGDCYTCYIDYVYGLYDASGNSVGITNFFPCECNANYNLRRGRKGSNSNVFPNAAPNSVVWDDGAGHVRLEDYNYNQAYSTEGQNIKYPALPLNFLSTGRFQTRIRYAGPKLNGETQDSFRVFQTLNFKDLSGQDGEINNIRTRDGRVIVWQNKALNTVPVLERQLLSATTGAATTIGVGGVVDRFDPLNSYFGNQHQRGLVETEYGFLWFDMRRKAVVVLDMSTGIMEVSKIDGLNGYFNEILVDNLGSTATTNPINSPDFLETSDSPLTGIGITGVYDVKFKMTFLTFKFTQRINPDQPINKDFTIGYYHFGKQFISFYDWTPNIAWNHNQFVISANNPKNKTKFYGAGMSSTNFLVGEIVSASNAEYICILPVTVASFPGTAGATGTNPVTSTTYWQKINETQQLWVNNQPAVLGQTTAPDYLYNSFFGQVVNNEIEFVVNPPTLNPVSVLNIEQKSNGVNVTDVYTDADGITAADNNITSTNRYYRKIYDSIFSNLPLSTTGRITSKYLKIRMVKKNWTTNPTIVTTLVKLWQYVKSTFEQKR